MDALLLLQHPPSSVGRLTLTLAAEGMSSKSSKTITASFFGTDRAFTAFRSLRDGWDCRCLHEEGDAAGGGDDGADFILLGGGSFPFLALLTVLVALAFLFTYDKECLEGTKSSSSSELAIFLESAGIPLTSMHRSALLSKNLPLASQLRFRPGIVSDSSRASVFEGRFI